MPTAFEEAQRHPFGSEAYRSPTPERSDSSESSIPGRGVGLYIPQQSHPGSLSLPSAPGTQIHSHVDEGGLEVGMQAVSFGPAPTSAPATASTPADGRLSNVAQRTARNTVQNARNTTSHPIPNLRLFPDSFSNLITPSPAIHQLNDHILLSVFNYYRWNEYRSPWLNWNNRFLWCKLFHVCRRWRNLIYECAFHLGIHIECSKGRPKANELDHLPRVPLLLYYSGYTLPEEDELWLYHVLRRLCDRVFRINLHLPPSILGNIVALMDQPFPILEDLSLSFTENGHPLTLPEAFLAPNLRDLSLPNISPPRGLWLLIPAVSLVTLRFADIQTSSYFGPRLLVERLQSLPQLRELCITFSTPIPRPSTERELLGEPGAPVTLPNLRRLRFTGIGTYLESLVAQLRVPLLEELHITLLNQIALALPHLFHLINITNAFDLPGAEVIFGLDSIGISTFNYVDSAVIYGIRQPLDLHVRCKPLDWQIDCVAQICHGLIPMLSGAEELKIRYISKEISSELRNGGSDSATWRNVLRPFTGVRDLDISWSLLGELSRALQEDEVGSDPRFLPNLESITAEYNLFTSFIDTRQVSGRPVRFIEKSDPILPWIQVTPLARP